MLGGARSGKSSLAEKLAREIGGETVFIATAEAGDGEMQARIAAHQKGRPAEWRTVEAPRDVVGALERDTGSAHVVLLDCVTVWASNLLLRGGTDHLDPDAAGDELMGQLGALHDWYRGGRASLIIVSDEVGMGLVPEYPSGRAFRDLLGRANQRLAILATEVYLMVAGVPIELKQLAARPWRQEGDAC